MVFNHFDRIKKKAVLSSLGGNVASSSSLDWILEFNPETESWTKIGTMKESRYNHAVSVVPFDDFANWCN